MRIPLRGLLAGADYGPAPIHQQPLTRTVKSSPRCPFARLSHAQSSLTGRSGRVLCVAVALLVGTMEVRCTTLWRENFESNAADVNWAPTRGNWLIGAP